ncbi:uncharacterized protein LTR77_009745 [Saxophila tyrrhenica]|uniref:BTB domain-containing protein n=1 Tax=Saxophila tyrrhenica TaxID=1690608 RepID=A0AAV9NYX7_9PEZI|nr:hypothetical protein LTR77_009745 [Saxophila tyrrhenica]
MDEVNKISGLFESDVLITIAPENSNTKFQVPRALLCHASQYFKSALQGTFAEASTWTLTLLGYDVDTIRLFFTTSSRTESPADILQAVACRTPQTKSMNSLPSTSKG